MPTAVQYSLLTTIQSAVQGRALTIIGGSALPNANVVLQPVPSNLESDLPSTPYPSILVAPWAPEGLNPAEGSTSRDDIYYRILVCILASKNDFMPASGGSISNLNVYFYWRESIRKLFHDQASALSSVNSAAGVINQVQVQPLEPVDKRAWRERQIFASGMVLNIISREPRG
jgi:hypothetical protein